MSYENDEIYEDDLDLLELLTADSNSTNQYLLFDASNNETYAMNVAKIVEILTFKDIKMVKNSKDSIIKGTAKIRDEIATVINFDQWFGNDILDDKEYEYLILAGFGGYNIAIMVKNVDYIITIDSNNMKDNSINNPKTTFISQIKYASKEKLCTIFDTDKMLLDIFGDGLEKKIKIDPIKEKTVDHEKIILFADDSRYIRKMVTNLFKDLNIKYMEFENGQELVDKLLTLDPLEVGLIISDLEMPVMDGVHLIKQIKQKMAAYSHIDIIIHTNMSNFITQEYLKSIGTTEIIDKINMQKLSESILRLLK